MPVNAVMRNFFHGTQRVVKMQYSTAWTLVLAAGYKNFSSVIRANSIYDPWNGAGGTVANGYTIASTYWNHYCVLGAKITATFCPNAALAQAAGYAANPPLMLFIRLQDTDTGVDTSWPSELFEMNGEQKYRYIRANDHAIARTTCYFSARKFFNVSDVKDNDDLESTFGANPTEQAYFHVGVALPTSVALGLGGAQATLGHMLIRVQYIVSLSEHKPHTVPPE